MSRVFGAEAGRGKGVLGLVCHVGVAEAAAGRHFSQMPTLPLNPLCASFCVCNFSTEEENGI